MLKRIIYCFTLSTLILPAARVKAQQEPLQIVINGGVGYSPGFDGDINIEGTIYPVKTINGEGLNCDCSPYPAGNFSSVTRNIGGTIDVGVTNQFSIGLAGSYQSEVANWTPTSNYYPYPNYDKIARTNTAARFLFHTITTNVHFDLYTGIRLGLSYWSDIPSSDNQVIPTRSNNGTYSYGLATFLNSPNSFVPSFQVLLGLRAYIIESIGLHAEVGLGSPYLAEGGLTFRINTHKEKSTQPTFPPDNSKK